MKKSKLKYYIPTSSDHLIRFIVPVIALICLVIAIVVTSAQALPTYEEDFESRSLGDLNGQGGWTSVYSYGGSVWNVQSGVVYSGIKAVQGNGIVRYKLIGDENRRVLSVTYHVRINSINNSETGLYLYENDTVVAGIKIKNGTFRDRNDVFISNASINTWYKVETQVYTKNSTFSSEQSYINDGVNGSSSNYSLPSSEGINNIRLISYSNSLFSYAYYDDIISTDIDPVTWTNDYTNNSDLELTVQQDTEITFSVIDKSLSVDLYLWFYDNYLVGLINNYTTVSIDTTGQHQVKAVLENFSDYNLTREIIWNVTKLYKLVLPSPNSSLYYDYPPQTKNVTFEWENTQNNYVRFLVSDTSNMGHIVYESFVLGASTYVPLTGASTGTKYYWYIQDYNTATGIYGLTSPISNFTLYSNSTINNSIQGIVYEYIGTVRTPISGALVTLYNNSWSSSVITGSNGYYIFIGLSNTTYTILASKTDYDNSLILPVTIPLNSVNDIELKKCTTNYNCFYTQEYQTMKVYYKNGYTPVAGALVKLYDADAPLFPHAITTTDSTGYARVLLGKDVLYNVVITIGNFSASLMLNTDDTDWIIIIGLAGSPVPSYTPPPNNSQRHLVNGSSNYSNVSFFKYSGDYLNSSIGLGSYGQGILVGLINWIVVGAGGIVTCAFVSAMLAYNGIISWVTVIFFVLTGVSLWVIKGT